MAYLAYFLVVAIWGTTWIFVNMQVDAVPPIWAVTYRFGLAALILWAMTLARRPDLRMSRQENLALICTGLCMFGLNYLLLYLSSVTLTSGLVALAFSCMTFWNIVNGKLFLKTPVAASVWIAALLGALGLGLIFYRDISSVSLSSGLGLSILLAFCAGFIASLGNTIAASGVLAKHSPVTVSTYGMTYGSLFTGAIAFTVEGPPVIDTSLSFLLILAHLSLFGTVVSFTLYLWLLREIGLAKPAYIAVLAPLVAILVSSLFEGYEWTSVSLSGLALVLLGNILIIRANTAESPVSKDAPAQDPE